MKNPFVLCISYLLLSYSTFLKAQDSILYLSILSPSSIVKTYFQDSSDFRQASGWGIGISGNNIITSAIIPRVEPMLCIDDKTDFTGKIAIIRRGTCEFSVKALVAQNKGAIAVILVNYENTVLSMAAGSVGAQINIPVIMVKKDIGDIIIGELEKQEEVILSMGKVAEGFGLIQGYVRRDQNSNCKADSTDPGLRQWLINIKDKIGNNFQVKSDDNGFYRRYLSPLFGPYKLSIQPPNLAWTACDTEKLVQVRIGDTSLIDFVAQSNKDCVELHTDISATRLRKCFLTEFYVKICNEGTVTTQQCYVDVGLANEFGLINNSNISYSIIAPNLYRFQLGDLQTNECITVHFNAKVNCDSVDLGQTLCYFAQAYPDTTCIEYNPIWSGADVQLTGQCAGKNVEFTIKNGGKGNMNSVGKYVVIQDDQLYQSSTFQLLAGESKNIVLPANGATWHLEATQESNHPNSSIVSKTIEACSTNGNFSTGYAMMFPPPSKGFTYDEECQQVRGSFDPNEKEGFPLGYGFSNLIKPTTELEYFIHFQNMGTDTAYTVVVEDELPLALDPSSIHSILSSHPYRLEILSGNKLSFKFENILLVDSFANESASNGFVSFKIKQRKNNPVGTTIENYANIYFDFNSGVLTNPTYHEIGEVIGVVASKDIEKVPGSYIYPNPGNSESIFRLESIQFDKMNWELINFHGQKICSGIVNGKTIKLPGAIVQKGFYLLEILENNRVKIIKKIILD